MEDCVRRSLSVPVIALLLAVSGFAQARPFNDPRSERSDAIDADAKFAAEPRDPACYAAVLASTGGEMPNNPHTLAIRWTGFSNFELVYNGQIMLLDAYFERGSNYPPLGFKPEDVKKRGCDPDRTRPPRPHVGCSVGRRAHGRDRGRRTGHNGKARHPAN